MLIITKIRKYSFRRRSRWTLKKVNESYQNGGKKTLMNFI